MDVFLNKRFQLTINEFRLGKYFMFGWNDEDMTDGGCDWP